MFFNSTGKDTSEVMKSADIKAVDEYVRNSSIPFNLNLSLKYIGKNLAR